MAERLYMIALSPTMNEGTITSWKVGEGEAFKAGQVLCEVETDKASMDYEAPKDATLLKTILPQGGKAQVGEVIAIVGAPGEDFSALLDAAAPKATATMPAAPVQPLPAVPAAERVAMPVTMSAAKPPASGLPARENRSSGPVPDLAPGLPPSSPLARALARRRGVDLRDLVGTGPRGRIVLRDVEGAGAAGGGRSPGGARPAPAQARGDRSSAGHEDRRTAVSGKRAVIARRLSESFFAAPHFYLTRRVAMERLLELRAALNVGREQPLSLNAFFVKLAAEAISRHRTINSIWEGDSILERGTIDVALAVALPDGLVTPVARDCASKTVSQIDAELSGLVEKARGRGLAPEDYEGATFTISNLGSFGVEEFTAIINPPGSAILAIGAAMMEPVVLPDGSIGARRLAALTLGCDHRVIDGAAGAAFLATLASYIEEPGRALV